MNLFHVTYYPKSDATKPSQCRGTGMTREGNTGMRGEENTGMTEDETTGTFIFESKLHSGWCHSSTALLHS